MRSLLSEKHNETLVKKRIAERWNPFQFRVSIRISDSEIQMLD